MGLLLDLTRMLVWVVSGEDGPVDRGTFVNSEASEMSMV